MIEFTGKNGQIFRFPAPWQGNEPRWLRDHGRTVVAVIDDQIQTVAGLADKRSLEEQVCTPLNTEFIFFEECAAGSPLAKNRAWFDRVAQRLAEMRERLAIVLLDLMFDDESDAIGSTGLAFLEHLFQRETIGSVPIVIMTQATDSPRLQQAIGGAGYSRDFFQKDSDNTVNALKEVLAKHAWLSDPRFTAFSPEMRVGLVKLRQYAINRQYLMGPDGTKQVPLPLLIKAPSGEGKTWMAKLAAEWLMEWEPPVRPQRKSGQQVIQLNCNAFEPGQSALIALFGRGPVTGDKPGLKGAERTDDSGLVERGAAQDAAGGILLIDELGNSDEKFQNYLITFVETGMTEPEFKTEEMKKHREAVGPLDVLCIFTAQPKHIEAGKITPDMHRRFSRGADIDILPIHQRPHDIVPVFYNGLKAFRKQHDPSWVEPEDLAELLLPEAQQFLIEEIVRSGVVRPDAPVTSSRLIDLVGQPSARVIGAPHLKVHLEQVASRTSTRRGLSPPVPQAGDAPKETGTSQTLPSRGDLSSLLQAMSAIKRDAFPTHPDEVARMNADVYGAATNLLLSYLEAGLYANGRPPERTKPDITNTARTLFDGHVKNLSNPKAKSKLAGLMMIDLDSGSVLTALRESDWLARLAVEVADRSEPVRASLRVLSWDPEQAQRLTGFGWSDSEPLLDALRRSDVLLRLALNLSEARRPDAVRNALRQLATDPDPKQARRLRNFGWSDSQQQDEVNA